jgi:hypothetical protein
VADGSTDELRKTSESEYSLNLSIKGATEEEVRNLLSPLDGVAALERTGADQDAIFYRLQCRTTEDIREDIYDKIKRQDWTLLEFSLEAKSLEKIFRELTKEVM